MSVHLYMLTPGGTSLLTNMADSDDRKAVIRNSNCRSRSEVSPPDLVRLDRALSGLMAGCAKKVIGYLQSHHVSSTFLRPAASLDFKPLQSRPCPPSTHEVDAREDRG
ncbi:hypothetical protein, partial [Desulfolithobacter sp.]